MAWFSGTRLFKPKIGWFSKHKPSGISKKTFDGLSLVAGPFVRHVTNVSFTCSRATSLCSSKSSSCLSISKSWAEPVVPLRGRE